jgi:hypothetical protein
LPKSLESLVVEGNGPVLKDSPKIPDLPHLSTLRLSSNTYFDSDHLFIPRSIVRLRLYVKDSSFDSRVLPSVLQDLDLTLYGPWLPKHSEGLPRSLTTFSFEMAKGEVDESNEGYFSLPSNVRKLTLRSNLKLKVSAMSRIPKSLLELHMPLSIEWDDEDLALVPRHWHAMSLGQLNLTGKTIKGLIETLTMQVISDSIVKLLPPQMKRFWHIPSAASLLPLANQCVLSFEKGLFEIPDGVKYIDLKYVKDAKNLKFKDQESSKNQQQKILKFSSEHFAPLSCRLPSTLTSYYSNVEAMNAMATTTYLPEGLVELLLPRYSLRYLPTILPKLKKLQVQNFQPIFDDSASHSKFPNLTHLISVEDKAIFRALEAKVLPRNLKIMEWFGKPNSLFHWSDLDFPPSLTILHCPRCVLSSSSLLGLPQTLQELVVQSINFTSSDLVAALPSFGSTNINASFLNPEDHLKELSAILAPSSEKLVEIRKRFFDYWSTLTVLSNASLNPIVISLIQAIFPNMQRAEMACTVAWEISDLPYLPSSLETIEIRLSMEKTVSRMQFMPQSTESSLRVQFYSPSKGRVSSRPGKDLTWVAHQLLKPCYASLPSHLTRITFSYDVPHWLPRLLPRTLEIFECYARLLNLASYRDLPPGLKALRLEWVKKFSTKHALALPQTIEILDMRYHDTEDRLLAHLPRSLKVFISDSNKVTPACLELLPPSLTILDVPSLTVRYPHIQATNLPPSMTRKIIPSRNSSNVNAQDWENLDLYLAQM